MKKAIILSVFVLISVFSVTGTANAIESVGDIGDIKSTEISGFSRNEAEDFPPVEAEVPSITILSPNGGEVYEGGQQINVKWKTENISADKNVSIYVRYINPTARGVWTTNLLPYPNVTVNDGEEIVNLPSKPFINSYNSQYGKNFEILVIYNDGYEDIVGVSADKFSIKTSVDICQVNNKPYIEVVSPDGGEEVYSDDQEIVVKWSTCNISEDTQMRIDLMMYKDNGVTIVRNLSLGTQNDGMEIVKLPSKITWPQMVYGDYFRIKIRRVSTTTAQDLSGNTFSIIKRSFVVAPSSDNPETATVKVDKVNDTNNVVMLKGNLSYAGVGAVTIDEIPFTFTTVGARDVSTIVRRATLVINNGVNYQEVVSSNLLNSSVVTFDNLDLEIESTEVIPFTIMVDVDNLKEGVFDNGDTLTVSLTSDNLKSIELEDDNANTLPLANRSGSAMGNKQTFRASGVVVEMVNSNRVPTHNPDTGEVTEVTYTMNLKLTAFGSDQYVGKSASVTNVASAKSGISYVFQNSNKPNASDIKSKSIYTLDITNATTVGNAYLINEGNSAYLRLDVVLQTPSIPNSNYRLALKQLRTFSDSALTKDATNIDLLPQELFKTGFQFINN